MKAWPSLSSCPHTCSAFMWWAHASQAYVNAGMTSIVYWSSVLILYSALWDCRSSYQALFTGVQKIPTYLTLLQVNIGGEVCLLSCSSFPLPNSIHQLLEAGATKTFLQSSYEKILAWCCANSGSFTILAGTTRTATTIGTTPFLSQNACTLDIWTHNPE